MACPPGRRARPQRTTRLLMMPGGGEPALLSQLALNAGFSLVIGTGLC